MVYDPRVIGNSSTGAVVNLLVDGVTGGEVQSNSMSGAQGTRGHNNCPYADDYTVAHTWSVSLQPDWVFRIYDNGAPCAQ
jgi:hypothetical protein